MKRDMDLVRGIMLAVEKKAPNEQLDGAVLAGYFPQVDAAVVVEHVRLLEQARYLEASIVETMDDGASDVLISRITWEGYEYLGAVRDDTVWAKTKVAMKRVGGELPIAALKALASSIGTAAATDVLHHLPK